MWITFCSQTGTEIMNLSLSINRVPDMIVTNNYKKLSSTVLEWIKEQKINVTILPFNPTIESYSKLNYEVDGTLITLHGYLRILPASFCKKYVILNGHPGLITIYPELKGKDPQEKAFNLGLTTIGSVIHRVTEGVDEGEVITVVEKSILPKSSLEDYYTYLKEASLEAWKLNLS
jgi:folate-dependent phosphoribosylglycinamide formyltransferase PurN